MDQNESHTYLIILALQEISMFIYYYYYLWASSELKSQNQITVYQK